MPALTAIALAGLGLSAAGTVMSVMGSEKQAAAEEGIAKQNQLQMNLDAARNRRSIARQATYARSTALSNATNSGAAASGSSGVAGGMAAVTNQAGVAQLGNNQNQSIANTLFGLQQSAYEGGTLAMTGGAIGQFGGTIMQNTPQLAKAGSYFTKGWGQA